MLTNKSFSDIFTFSRASTGTRINQNGQLEVVPSNQPRFDYDPVTLACKGILIEEQRTNTFSQSSNFSAGTWSLMNLMPFGSGSVLDAVAAPDNSVTADKITADAVSGRHGERITVTTVAGATYTYSIFVKNAGYGFVCLTHLYSSASAGGGYIFDLANKVCKPLSVSAGYEGPPSIVDAGNGFLRCSVTFTNPATNPVDFIVFSLSNSYSPSIDVAYRCPSFTGDGTSGVYLWGAQLEVGSFATSYIPTNGSQVTRAADVCSINTLSPWYNQTEGALFVEANTFSSNDAKAVSLTDGTSTGQNNCFVLDYASSAGKTRFSVTAGGVGQASFSSIATYTKGSVVKIAGAYSANNFGGTTNSESITTDSSGSVPTVSVLEVGFHRKGNPTQWWNGHVKKFRYFPKRLTNAELQSMTA